MIEIYEKNYKLVCMVDISLSINGVILPSTKGIIDTGCQITRISVSDICKNYSDPLLLKANDIAEYRKGNLNISRSIGVNDSKSSENLSLLSDKDLLRRDDICFIHNIGDLRVNGQSLGSHDVKYAYRYDSPTLIGMNILSKFKWSYENGVFRLYDSSGKSGNIFDCIRKMRDFIFKDKMVLSDVKSMLVNDFTDDCINEAIVQLLNNTYYEGD